MPRSVANAVRRLVPPPSRTGLFLALLAAAAWLDSPAPPAAEPPLPEETPAEQKPSGGQQSGEGKPPPWYRPFEGNYTASLISAIVALAPFIIVTTAYALFLRHVEQDVHASRTALSIVSGLAVAGYAFGALLGGDLVQRFPQRYMFFIAEALFALGCLLSAVAHAPPTYAAGRIVSGFGTGLLLVVALPPVIQKFPASKLPITVVAINIGFFGAVCIGPLLGGWVDAGHNWRWFYGALGAIAVANLLLAALTLPEQPPFNPDMRFDLPAILLGFASVVLPFWASGELAGHGFASARFAGPMFVGLICFTMLLLIEYHQKEPLSPVKPMWTTQSVTGTLVAMIGGGVFVTFLELGETFHMQVAHQSPLATGILFWPLAPGALISAAIFGAILRTRFIPILVLAGMVCIMGGGALLLFLSPHGSRALTLAAAGLLGLGAGIDGVAGPVHRRLSVVVEDHWPGVRAGRAGAFAGRLHPRPGVDAGRPRSIRREARSARRSPVGLDHAMADGGLHRVRHRAVRARARRFAEARPGRLAGRTRDPPSTRPRCWPGCGAAKLFPPLAGKRRRGPLRPEARRPEWADEHVGDDTEMNQREVTGNRSGWLLLCLLWLLGVDLRLTILAVPPVLPLIHRDLHLDEKLVAALTGLPVLLFGLIAIPGSLMIARIGARRAAIAGVLIVSIASALRGVGPSVPMLFGMTALMGAGVAIMQPALPTLVGRGSRSAYPLPPRCMQMGCWWARCCRPA